MIHQTASPLSGTAVRIKSGCSHPQINDFAGAEYQVEDWWDRIGEKPWGNCKGNPACLVYGIRAGQNGLPLDNEVLYGKIGPFGHLVHVSEIELPTAAEEVAESEEL